MMRPAQSQRGATLIVVLILVLLVSLAGIAAVRSLVLEERMAANSLDRSLAMQSAENVMRQAEGIAQQQSIGSIVNLGFPDPGSGKTRGVNTLATCQADGTDASPCVAGLCSQPTIGCTPRWESANSGWEDTTLAQSNESELGGKNMQYLIEFLNNTSACEPNDPDDLFNCSQYRITVRSKPSDSRAFVQLQAYYLAMPK